jgi:hypothetical protein
MRQIYVDSRDRVSGTSTNFSIQLPQTLSLEGGGHSARVDNLRLPIAVPTITSGVNDTITVLIGASSYTAGVTQANFDGSGLATAIQNALAAVAPGTWTCSYDVSNIAMTLSCSNSFTITGGTLGAQLLSRPYTRPSGTVYKFSYVPVNGIDQVYLCCTDFANLDIVGPNGAHDTLCSVIVTEPYGSVQDYSMTPGIFFDIPNVCTQQLSFQLRDRSYNLLNSIANFSFVLNID